MGEADWKEHSVWGEGTGWSDWDENGRTAHRVGNTRRVGEAFSARVKEFVSDFKIVGIYYSFLN